MLNAPALLVLQEFFILIIMHRSSKMAPIIGLEESR